MRHQSLMTLIASVLADPELLARKKAGVDKLKAEQLNYQDACKPLLAFLSVAAKKSIVLRWLKKR